MGNTQARTPNANLLAGDKYEIKVVSLVAGDTGYKAGDILTFDGVSFSKASLPNDDNHTEAFAVCYEDVEAGATSGATVLWGAVRESELSADYQALSDEDKAVVIKELYNKNIYVEA